MTALFTGLKLLRYTHELVNHTFHDTLIESDIAGTIGGRSDFTDEEAESLNETEIVDARAAAEDINPGMAGDQKNGTKLSPATYYVTVQALNGAGLPIASATKGVTIDTTPPMFKDFSRPECGDKTSKTKNAAPCGFNPQQYDVAWLSDLGDMTKLEPTYQGNTDTIASKHKAVDMESPIMKYEIMVTNSTGIFIPFIYITEENKGLNHQWRAKNAELEANGQMLEAWTVEDVQINNLNLTQGETYCVVVRAYNAAGLWTDSPSKCVKVDGSGPGLISFVSSVLIGESVPASEGAFGSSPPAALSIKTAEVLACTSPQRDAGLTLLQSDAKNADAAIATAEGALTSTSASDRQQMQRADAAVARAKEVASAAHQAVATYAARLGAEGVKAVELLTKTLAAAQAALQDATAPMALKALAFDVNAARQQVARQELTNARNALAVAMDALRVARAGGDPANIKLAKANAATATQVVGAKDAAIDTMCADSMNADRDAADFELNNALAAKAALGGRRARRDTVSHELEIFAVDDRIMVAEKNTAVKQAEVDAFGSWRGAKTSLFGAEVTYLSVDETDTSSLQAGADAVADTARALQATETTFEIARAAANARRVQPSLSWSVSGYDDPESGLDSVYMAIGSRPKRVLSDPMGEEDVPFFFVSRGEGVYVSVQGDMATIKRLDMPDEPGFTPSTRFDLPTLLRSDVFTRYDGIKGQTYFMNVRAENFAHLSTVFPGAHIMITGGADETGYILCDDTSDFDVFDSIPDMHAPVCDTCVKGIHIENIDRAWGWSIDGGKVITSTTTATSSTTAATNATTAPTTVNPLTTCNAGLAVGVLVLADMKRRYASNVEDLVYEQYVHDPETYATDLQSRQLLNRIDSYLGVSFFVSPIEQKELDGPITITVDYDVATYDAAAASAGDFKTRIPILAYWNQFHKQWIDVASTCSMALAPFQPKAEHGKIKVQVCETNLNYEAMKREVPVVSPCTCSSFCSWDKCHKRCTVEGSDLYTEACHFDGKASKLGWLGAETQFSLFYGKADTVNTAPHIADVVLTVAENSVLRADLNYTDLENDVAIWSLQLLADAKNIPGHLTLHDNGTVVFEPVPYFHGTVEAMVAVVEDLGGLGAKPLLAQAKLTIVVQPRPSAPLVFFRDDATGQLQYGGDLVRQRYSTDAAVNFTAVVIHVDDPHSRQNISMTVGLKSGNSSNIRNENGQLAVVRQPHLDLNHAPYVFFLVWCSRY